MAKNWLTTSHSKKTSLRHTPALKIAKDGPRWTHYFLSWFYREDQGNPNFSPKCAATIASICVNLQNFISWSSASPVAQPEGQIWSCLTWKGDPKWRWKSTPLLSCRHGPLAPFGAAVNMRGWAAMGWKVWCGKFDDSFLWSQEVSAFYLPGVGPTEYLDVWGLQISTDASTWQLVCKVSPVPLGHALQIQNDMIQTGSMHTSTGISTHFGAFAKRLQHLRSKETFHRFINHLQMASGWICSWTILNKGWLQWARVKEVSQRTESDVVNYKKWYLYFT